MRLHSSVGLDGVELRLTKKDNKSLHGMNVGDWDTVLIASGFQFHI